MGELYVYHYGSRAPMQWKLSGCRTVNFVPPYYPTKTGRQRMNVRKYIDPVDLLDDTLNGPDFDKLEGAEIDYENSKEVAEQMAWHLARIFRATFRDKLEMEVEKLKNPKG